MDLAAMFLRAASAVAVSLLLIALQNGGDTMATPCEDLKAAIDAESDNAVKAQLEERYARECGGDDPQGSGGNGPPPKNPR